jgi:hypothetical protein
MGYECVHLLVGRELAICEHMGEGLGPKQEREHGAFWGQKNLWTATVLELLPPQKKGTSLIAQRIN